MRIFWVLAIFVACLGLFGLASFTAEQNVKEIGLRKALGPSSKNIVGIFVRSFLKPVVASFVVGSPLAWWIMNRWLNQFAYRTEIGINVFLNTAILVFTIALVTIMHRTLTVARCNPVEALRYE